MRLWALSDLHVSHPANREALESFPAFPDDWLILAGDVTDGAQRLDWCFRQLTPKFRQIVWVPGNHELWTIPNAAPELRGVALYERLVEIARSHGVLTPEDPYPVVELEDGPVLIAPLFLLYDYSFRPRHVPRDEVVRWAQGNKSRLRRRAGAASRPVSRTGIRGAPHAAEEAAARLAAFPAALRKVLINHYPLEEQHAVLPRIPRFSPWCGTRRTEGWHRRFNACAVVYGHLHIRGTQWLDGVPFHEVSLGYPKDWDVRLGVAAYLQEVTRAPQGGALAMTAGSDVWWSPWREAEDLLILHVDLRPHAERHERAVALLDAPEKARWNRFVVKGARHQYALCRAALRINLCARLGCSNRDLSFGYLEHGKPYAEVSGARSSASFNVSHSGEHGLIAFADRDGLGVDLEVRTPGRDFDGIGSCVYGPQERRALSAASGTREGGSVLPALEHEGSAHQGARHRLLAEPGALRGAAADARRRADPRCFASRNGLPIRTGWRIWENPASPPPAPAGSRRQTPARAARSGRTAEPRSAPPSGPRRIPAPQAKWQAP